MDEFWLKCFGTGDGWPAADRSHSAFLYRVGNTPFLMDCGEPISRSYKASGLSYDLPDRLFLSHFHFDHAGGFFMFMQSLWLEGRTKPLVVHMPTDGLGPLRQVLHAGCIFDELLPFPLLFEPLAERKPVAWSGTTVTPFPTTHLAGLQAAFQGKYPHSFAAFSFLVEAGSLRIGHTADIGSVDDLAPLIDNRLDVLVCELAHIPAEELFTRLRGRDIGRVLFVHLSRQLRIQKEVVEKQARELLHPIAVEFPADGSEFSF